MASNDTAGLPAADNPAAWALTLIQTRQTVLPRRLVAPGPDDAQQRLLFEAAAAAPDHEQRLPWRFIVVPHDRRDRLADAFAQALLERDPAALPRQVEAAREKAHRAPFVMLALARLVDDDVSVTGQGSDARTIVPAPERWISLGCAIQNMLLLAHAMGYGAALTSGQAIVSPALRELFALGPGEEPVCFVNIGTVSQRKPMRPRPDAKRFVSSL
ncbi:MAG: nitroreductase [Burkholderiales bacterium]